MLLNNRVLSWIAQWVDRSLSVLSSDVVFIILDFSIFDYSLSSSIQRVAFTDPISSTTFVKSGFDLVGCTGSGS